MLDTQPDPDGASAPKTYQNKAEEGMVDVESGVTLRNVRIRLCDGCLNGASGECHTAGCALWLNRAPDLRIHPELYDYSATLHEQVVEFHQKYGQPISTSPHVPADERVRLRLRLIAEEFFELLDSCGIGGVGTLDAKDLVSSAIGFVSSSRVDILQVVDALADIDYVIEGTRIEFGVDGGPVAAEVHRSNLSKLGADGKPVLNRFGKVVKGPAYSPPDIGGVLRAQGWKSEELEQTGRGMGGFGSTGK